MSTQLIRTIVAGGMRVIGEYRLDMERRGLTPRSIYQLLGHVRSFQRWLLAKGRDLDTATHDDVQVFLDSRKIGARTRYTWISSLHGFYAFAVRTGRMEADPTQEITRPKLRRTLPRPITDGDLTVALELAQPMMRTWVSLAAFGGLRCGEIAGLKADDVLYDAGMLRVLGKGQNERLVPMHPRVSEVLSPPRRGPVFTRSDGAAFTPKQVSRTGSLYFQSIGVEATLHQCRHWYATRLYAMCHDLRIVQELLGHSSPSTTSIYVAFSKADAIEAVRALDLTA